MSILHMLFFYTTFVYLDITVVPLLYLFILAKVCRLMFFHSTCKYTQSDRFPSDINSYSLHGQNKEIQNTYHIIQCQNHTHTPPQSVTVLMRYVQGPAVKMKINTTAGTSARSHSRAGFLALAWGGQAQTGSVGLEGAEH